MGNTLPTKNRIIDIRKSMNYSQAEFGKVLAKFLNRKTPYPVSTVSYWEIHCDTIPLDIVFAICNIAHCSSDYLLGFSDIPFQIEKCNEIITEMDNRCIITFTEKYKEIGYAGLVNTEKRAIIFKNGYELTFDELTNLNLYKYDPKMEVADHTQLFKYHKESRPIYALTLSNEETSNKDGWYYFDINLGCCINEKNDCLYLCDYNNTWIALV